MSKKTDSRPVNLALTTFKFPITAIASILHRMSGVILFLFVPFLLYLLGYSLSSAEQFDKLTEVFSSIPIKLMVFVFLVALIYHVLAGVRHLLMDCGLGESLKGGRAGAMTVMILTVFLAIFAGVLLLW